MPKNMFVNVVNEEESRIAITAEGLLEELAIETASHEQIEGNLYKAKIVKILASLDAAFVDYGSSRNGFLAFSDIHPQYFGEGKRGAEGLRKGQELLVQVRKGELGQKGAALTTYVSIPGRYIVLMPLVSKRGVSRKVQDEGARKELRDVLEGSGIPEDMGYIVRTAGSDQTKQDLTRDVSYLLRLWKNIQSQYASAKTGTLLYQESDIVIRTIRDYFSPSIQEVWVDNEEICEQVRAFFRAVMPWYQKRVHLYRERVPLFSKFDLESQIASIYEKTVPLPSGGSIIIEQTEALVSIDVNSGKTLKGKDIEETALIANREAAEEAARQLRLRDLGGLIVIDFIDMRSASHRNEVRKALQKALKEDKARTDTGTISKFGMLELSRQRVKPAGLRVASPCPVCSGTGKTRSPESLSLAVLRMIQSELAKGSRLTQVVVGLPAEVAVLLLNRKRRVLLELETDSSTSITICAEPLLQANQYYIEYRLDGVSRVVTNLSEDFPRAQLRAPQGLPGLAPRPPRQLAYALLEEPEEEIPEVPEEPPEEQAGEPAEAAEGAEKQGKKRKRRRKKKKAAPEGGEAPAPSAVPVEEVSPLEPPSVPEAAAELASEASPEGAIERKLSPSAKRRARRRRKKVPGAPAERPEAAPEADEAGSPEPSPAEPPSAEAAPSVDSSSPAWPVPPAESEQPKPEKAGRRRRRPARGKKEPVPAAEPWVELAPAASERAAPAAAPQPVPEEEGAPAKPPRRRKPRPVKRAAEAPAEEAERPAAQGNEGPEPREPAG
jgi:ribonuclease E